MSLQSTDQIADLITRIRNAIMVGKNEILVPTSKLKVGVVEVLKKNGYVAEYEVVDGKPRGVLKVTIFEPGTVAILGCGRFASSKVWPGYGNCIYL